MEKRKLVCWTDGSETIVSTWEDQDAVFAEYFGRHEHTQTGRNPDDYDMYSGDSLHFTSNISTSVD